MDALERKLVRAVTFLWHLVNVGVGVAIFVATVLYMPPGSSLIGVGGFSIDPFYLLVAFAVIYSCWTGIDFWRWYANDDSGQTRARSLACLSPSLTGNRSFIQTSWKFV